MTPSVSPRSTAKSTPSTALIQATLRRGKTPATLGKCLARPSASSSGGMQCPVVILGVRRSPPAPRAPAGGEANVIGLRAAADGQGLAAARLKGAAHRQPGEVGR